MSRGRGSAAAPLVVGSLLIVESCALLFVALLTTIIGGLAGGLAFVAGAGSATHAQLVKTGLVMVLCLVAPYIVAVALAFGGVLTLMQRQRGVVIATCLLALCGQAVFHVFVAPGFHWAALVPLSLHTTAIVVAFTFAGP